MKTNTNSRYAVAVLIDGDNASFEKMEDIMGFVSRYGDAVVRRIYGDWTRKALSAWKGTAREHGFRLVQASSHAPGKNTTDIALVIDAMDILRDGRADCFCLVASDGDYSLLAQRIREAGLKVLGYGEDKTPVSLVRSCSVFLYADRKENKVSDSFRWTDSPNGFISLHIITYFCRQKNPLLTRSFNNQGNVVIR